MTANLAPNAYPEERRMATVLFADLKGFTTLSEKLDLEQVTDFIKDVWNILDQVILDHNGYIDKHLGDGVMAIWGAPLAGEDDVERALSAALAMGAALNAYTHNHPQFEAVRLKIGVNTGMLLAAYMGLRNEYTVIGDTVNVASRLQEIAEPDTVLVSEATYRAARGIFKMQRLEPFLLRGKTEKVPVYLVQEKLDQPSRVRYKDVGGLQTVMVAREEAWNQLMAVYQESHTGFKPSLAVVTGDIGLGKSRLLMEFTSHLESVEKQLTLLSVRSLAQAEKSPFFIWSILWKDRFGLTDDLSPDLAREKFLRGVLKLWGNRLGSVSAVEAAHMIGDLIGIPWPNSPFIARYEEAPVLRVQRAFEMTRELLSRIAETGPTILLIDDLQWVDKGSLDLLAYLMEPAPRPLPLFILGAGRPELFRKNVRLANLARLIQLKPIAFTLPLVRKAYPVLASAPESLVSQLAERSDGNPYYLEEMVKTMVNRNQHETDSSTMEPEWPNKLEPSGNLQTIIQSRLDALPREARDVAILASVVGRVFWEGAILVAARQPSGTGLLNLPAGVLERVLQNGLRHLVRAEMAFPRAGSIFTGEREYIFKHSLVREVAYSLLPEKYRKSYHFAVANWLSQRAGPDFQVMVADHFEHAGDRGKAIRHYEQALEFAHSRGVEDEARWLRTRVSALRSGGKEV